MARVWHDVDVRSALRLFAPNAKRRAQIVPQGERKPLNTASPAALAEAHQLPLFGTEKPPSKRNPWAFLLRHVFLVDVTLCPHCGGRVKWLQVATDPEDIRRALARLGLAPRGPPNAGTMRELLGQLSLPFGASGRRGSERLPRHRCVFALPTPAPSALRSAANSQKTLGCSGAPIHTPGDPTAPRLLALSPPVFLIYVTLPLHSTSVPPSLRRSWVVTVCELRHSARVRTKRRPVAVPPPPGPLPYLHEVRVAAAHEL